MLISGWYLKAAFMISGQAVHKGSVRITMKWTNHLISVPYGCLYIYIYIKAKFHSKLLMCAFFHCVSVSFCVLLSPTSTN